MTATTGQRTEQQAACDDQAGRGGGGGSWRLQGKNTCPLLGKKYLSLSDDE